MLEKLRNQLPNFKHDEFKAINWWLTNGVSWTRCFRELAIQHYDVGHEWEFVDDHQKLLQDYYYASQLMVECTAKSSFVSSDVRLEIEDTLFLPIAEIEKRKREKAK